MMAKMNHNRPSLRYLDNYRRELRREDRPTPSWFHPEKIKAYGIASTKLEKFPEYLKSFSNLNPKQQSIMGEVIEKYNIYLDSCISVIDLIMASNSKKTLAKRKAKQNAKDDAYESLVVMGASLANEILNDLEHKQDGVLKWFCDFIDYFDEKTQTSWRDLLDIILEESLPLCLAERVGDSPAEVNRLREFFTSKNLS